MDASNPIIEWIRFRAIFYLWILLNVFVVFIFVLVIWKSSIDYIANIWISLESMFFCGNNTFVNIHIELSWLRTLLALFIIKVEVSIAKTTNTFFLFSTIKFSTFWTFLGTFNTHLLFPDFQNLFDLPIVDDPFGVCKVGIPRYQGFTYFFLIVIICTYFTFLCFQI